MSVAKKTRVRIRKVAAPRRAAKEKAERRKTPPKPIAAEVEAAVPAKPDVEAAPEAPAVEAEKIAADPAAESRPWKWRW